MEQNIPKYKEPNRGRIAKTIAIAGVLVVLGLILVFSLFYELNEDEFAVITTFGKASVVSEPGLKMKIPFIQQKHYVSKATKGFAIGYDLNTGSSIDSAAY